MEPTSRSRASDRREEEATAPRAPSPRLAEHARQVSAEFGDFRITGIEGEGGVAVVYRVSQMGTDISGVLKVPIDFADRTRVDLLRDEARTLNHLHKKDPAHFPEVMEVTGGNGLKGYFAKLFEGSLERDIREGGLDRQTIRSRFDEAAGIIQTALDAGIVHADIKASAFRYQEALVLVDANLVLKEGRATVNDQSFSIVYSSELGDNAPKLRGTPRYWAPEQNYGIVTEKTNVYQLGAFLYEMAGGTWQGGVPRPLAPEHEPIYRIVLEAVAGDPSHRPPLPELRARVNEVLGSSASPALAHVEARTDGWLREASSFDETMERNLREVLPLSMMGPLEDYLSDTTTMRRCDEQQAEARSRIPSLEKLAAEPPGLLDRWFGAGGKAHRATCSELELLKGTVAAAEYDRTEAERRIAVRISRFFVPTIERFLGVRDPFSQGVQTALDACMRLRDGAYRIGQLGHELWRRPDHPAPHERLHEIAAKRSEMAVAHDGACKAFEHLSVSPELATQLRPPTLSEASQRLLGREVRWFDGEKDFDPRSPLTARRAAEIRDVANHYRASVTPVLQALTELKEARRDAALRYLLQNAAEILEGPKHPVTGAGIGLRAVQQRGDLPDLVSLDDEGSGVLDIGLGDSEFGLDDTSLGASLLETMRPETPPVSERGSGHLDLALDDTAFGMEPADRVLDLVRESDETAFGIDLSSEVEEGAGQPGPPSLDDTVLPGDFGVTESPYEIVRRFRRQDEESRGT